MSKEDFKKQLESAGNPRATLFQTKLGINPDSEEETSTAETKAEKKQEFTTEQSTKGPSVPIGIDDGPELTRKTYYLTPLHVEAIRILVYKKRMDVSECVRELLDKAIPPEIFEEAAEELAKLRRS